MRSNYVKCDTCKQAVHENAFEVHRQDKKCTSITLLFRYDVNKGLILIGIEHIFLPLNLFNVFLIFNCFINIYTHYIIYTFENLN